MAQIFNRGLTKKIDYPLVITLASLLLIGLMMVYSSSFDFGYIQFGQPTHFFSKQITWALLGTAGLIAMMSIEYHTWRRLSIPLMAGALFLLILVLLVGKERLGSVRFLLGARCSPASCAS